MPFPTIAANLRKRPSPQLHGFKGSERRLHFSDRSRIFYRNTLNRKIEIERIPLPRYEKKLPVILSKEEAKALLEAPKNLGHRAILAPRHGAGLRASEATHRRSATLIAAARSSGLAGATDTSTAR